MPSKVMALLTVCLTPNNFFVMRRRRRGRRRGFLGRSRRRRIRGYRVSRGGVRL